VLTGAEAAMGYWLLCDHYMHCTIDGGCLLAISYI
jgi:hypothetical protein